MKTFDEIYEELQNRDNSELNIAWKKAKKSSDKSRKVAITICLMMDIIFITLFSKNVTGSLFFYLYIVVFILMMNVVIFGILTATSKMSKDQREYNGKYKNIVISKIISNFYNNLEYFPNKTMPEYIYKPLGYEYYNKYKSDDYFEAQIDNKYSIQMAEILTQKEETYRDSDGKTHTRTITKFHGLFAKIIMHKSIKGELRVMQNGGLFFNKKLKMDSSEFEKHFDVKASDPIMGMQLLTADVMEELIEFENKTKMKFDIFINGNELYLRFHSGSMFEAGNLKNGVLDRNLLHIQRENFPPVFLMQFLLRAVFPLQQDARLPLSFSGGRGHR